MAAHKKGKAMEQPTEQTKRGRKDVFGLNERNGNTYWTKIGVAFVNRDESISLFLDAIPVSGKLQVREVVEGAERFTRSRPSVVQTAAHFAATGGAS